MRRRAFLELTGASVASAALGSVVAGASGRGSAPDDDIPTAAVHPFPLDQTVPTGSWIVHRFFWLDQHDPSKRRYVAEFLESVTTEAVVGGEPVADADQYYSEPLVHPVRGDWASTWRFVTPPKPPGEYEFEVVWTFDEPVDDGTEVFDGRVVLAGDYEVVTGERAAGDGTG